MEDESCHPDSAEPRDNEASAKKLHLHLPAWLTRSENAARAVFLLGPWASYLMVEVLNNNDPFHSLDAEQIALNLIWYYLIFWIFRMLIGRKGVCAAVSSGVCFTVGLLNHYVLTFRGRTIFPCDILSIRTALNVAGDFDYTPDRAIWTAIGILVLYWVLIFLAHLIFHPKGRQKLRLITSLGSWGLIAGFCGVFFFSGLLPAIGIYAQQWKTQANGFVLNFMAALRYSFVSSPDGYSAKAAQTIADSVTDNTDYTANTTQSESPTNLIVIMNESFADLAAEFPDLNLTDDPLPFYHSLTENTVKGTMVSPVTGGGTANVEFEYLTGDSLAFLPSSTVAYQLYLYDGAPSLVSQVRDLGYHTIAFHPYLSSGWNRTSVYSWLGFHDQLYQENVVNPQYVRGYISDACDYEQIYRMTDENDGPTFVFNVTMQNHSGYAQGWNNLERTVEAKDVPNLSVAAQYFSLIRKSDDAIRELINHYSDCSERTMIVFFGDHQPPLGNDFYGWLYGKTLDSRTTQEVLQQYGVPFFIWANYDIPEKNDLLISSNYLGTLTAELAGFKLTGYEKLHAKLMDVLPVATTIGYVTDTGLITDDESKLPKDTQQLYDQYRLMAYNHLFDEKNHPKGFYEN
jgi:glucan phosphoethanolaminetransferase (alkaline phosphatase superfamily)